MMIPKCFRVLLSLVLVAEMSTAAAAAAAATDEGFYVGMAYGQSQYEMNEDLDIFDIQTSQGQDDSDTALSIFMGYRANRYFRMEASYVDLGAATVYATGTFTSLTPQPITGRFEGEIASKGAAFSVLGSIPVKNLAFYGRIGLFMAHTDLTGTVSSGPLSGSDTTSASTTAIIFGVGAGYTFLNHFYVNVEYTQYPKLGDEMKTGERDVSGLTVGLAYRY